MDYASYRQFRDSVLKSRAPQRLDCMNPVRALAPMIRSHPAIKAKSLEETLCLWSKVTRVALPPGHFAVGTGIRDLLAATLRSLPGETQEIWLPSDVYPVYWEIARQTSFVLNPFTTLPEPDWSFLGRTGNQATVLFTWPVSPSGLLPGSKDTLRLISWLKRSSGRLLILDATYAFDSAAVNECIAPLFATGACIILWSCSKLWLQPASFGVAMGPNSITTRVAEKAIVPSPAVLAKILASIEEQPDFPLLQQRAFSREWQRLRPFIQSACQEWQPPKTGYFSVLHKPFSQLLMTHNLLAIPATVFGSAREDLSVATCLHDLIANGHDG